MKYKALGGAALLLCGLVAPALAGSVYVPLATDQVIDGVRYQTQIWVTNTDTGLRQFTSYLIESETDGTDRPENWGASTAIQAGDTMLLASVVGSGEQGMLEISGAPQIVVTARMVGTSNGVAGLGTAMPVVSSKSVFAANAVAHLAGWVRSADLRSDFGILNLGHERASCSIKVFRNDGSQILGTAVVTMQPLGHRQFDDALNLLGQPAISAARSETSCDQPFYIYLRTYDRTAGDVFFTLPSHTLGESTLATPDEEPPPGPGPGPSPSCSAGALCYSKPGTFFVPTVSADYRRETFEVPPGNYSKLHMSLEVVPTGWHPPTNGLNLVFWLARDGRHRNLYGFAGFKGPGSGQLLFRHGIGMEAGLKPKLTRNFLPTLGATYKIDFVYNTGNRTLTLKIMDAAGNVLHELTDRTNVNVIELLPGEANITADFSHRLGLNPVEPPSYGWQYRNLLIELFD
jgi:hypothetical protein